MTSECSPSIHANQVMQALQSGAARPMMAGPELPQEALAYECQKAVIGELSATDSVVGYKAAFTNEMARKAMGLESSGLGVLLANHFYAPANPVPTGNFVRGMLEVEIGYRLQSDITGPVTTDTVMATVGEILPVIELADGGYQTENSAGRKVCGMDFIAANTATAGFMPAQFDQIPQDTDAVQVSLSCDGEQLFTGTGADAGGGQLTSLCWLINKALSLGYELRAGHLLMTGSLGRVVPMQPGQYEARWQENGQTLFAITFQVR